MKKDMVEIEFFADSRLVPQVRNIAPGVKTGKRRPPRFYSAELDEVQSKLRDMGYSGLVLINLDEGAAIPLMQIRMPTKR